MKKFQAGTVSCFQNVLVYQWRENAGQTIRHIAVIQEAEFEWLLFLDRIFKIMAPRTVWTHARVLDT